MSRVVIVHGSYGDPQENWFPWLASELSRLGHDTIVPDFPTPDGQDLEAWQGVFRKEVGAVGPGMVLVGHSLGAGFILRVLEASRHPARGSFLVSGFLGSLGQEEFDRVNASFVNGVFDWEAIRRNAGRVRVYNSDTDPYVPLHKGRELAELVGVDLTVIHKGGHINAAAGFREFRQLLGDIKDLLAAEA